MFSKLPKTPPSADHVFCRDHGDYVPRGVRVCQSPKSSHIKPNVLKYMRISLPDVLILCNQYQFASTLVLKKDASKIAQASKDRGPEVWRCNTCNKLRSRVMRMQENHGRLVGGFSNLGQEEREKFNCEADGTDAQASKDGQPTVWRCKDCPKLRSRVMRMQENHGRLGASFSNLGQEEREKLMGKGPSLGSSK